MLLIFKGLDWFERLNLILGPFLRLKIGVFLPDKVNELS